MFNRFFPFYSALKRSFSKTSVTQVKVCLVGASGGVGKPLSLLMKMSPLIRELTLIDTAIHSAGVAKDLSHISTPCKVKACQEPDQLEESLQNSQLVIITAGRPQKKGKSHDDLFVGNSVVIKGVMESIAAHCPKALVGIVSDPINSLVPLANGVMEKAGKYDPKRIFGICTLDTTRAKTFVGLQKGIEPSSINIPVIGGHGDNTAIPLISQVTPTATFSETETKDLIKRIRKADTEIIEAKFGKTGTTISAAYSVGIMTSMMIRALKGEENVVMCSYVKSDVTDSSYLSTPLVLGQEGIKENRGIGKISPYEQELLQEAIVTLKKHIAKGEKFV